MWLPTAAYSYRLCSCSTGSATQAPSVVVAPVIPQDDKDDDDTFVVVQPSVEQQVCFLAQFTLELNVTLFHRELGVRARVKTIVIDLWSTPGPVNLHLYKFPFCSRLCSFFFAQTSFSLSLSIFSSYRSQSPWLMTANMVLCFKRYSIKRYCLFSNILQLFLCLAFFSLKILDRA